MQSIIWDCKILPCVVEKHGMDCGLFVITIPLVTPFVGAC